MSHNATVPVQRPICFHTPTRSTMAQRWMMQLGINGLNLVLKTVRHPEPVFNTIIKLGRLLSGLQVKFQTVGHKAWPYLTGGNGAPVVFLHGFGADKDRFGSLAPFFRRSFRVVIPDLPGFGDHATDWTASYGVDAQAQQLEQFLDAIGIEKCHLMGISLGGYIAAYYAVRYPHRVKSLCLMGSAGFSSPVPSDALALFQSGKRNIFLITNGQEVQDMTDYLLHNSPKLPPAVKHHWASQGRQLLPWRKKIFNDLLSGGLNLMDDLARKIDVPTLVIWGGQDRICHVSAVDTILSRINNCQAHIIQGCGHIPIIEHPVLTQNIYMDFLRQNNESSPHCCKSRRAPLKVRRQV